MVNMTSSPGPDVWSMENSRAGPASIGSIPHFLAMATSIVYLMAVLLCSLIGNVLVLYVIIRHLSIASLPNAYVASLSASDLLATLLCLPLTLFAIVSSGWTLGSVPCVLAGALQTACAIVSTLMVTCVLVDRYAILGTIPHRPGYSRVLAVGLNVGVWSVALLLAIPYQGLAVRGGVLLPANQTGPFYHCVSVFHTVLLGAGSHVLTRSAYRTCVVCACFLVPFTLMGFCCAQLACLIRHGRTRVRPSSSNIAQLWLSAELRTARTAMLMALLHVATRGPYIAMSLVTLALGDPFSLVMDTVGMWIFWASCAVNPILYTLRSPNFSNVLHLRRQVAYRVGDMPTHAAHEQSNPTMPACTPSPRPDAGGRRNWATVVTGNVAAGVTHHMTPAFIASASIATNMFPVFRHYGTRRNDSVFSISTTSTSTAHI